MGVRIVDTPVTADTPKPQPESSWGFLMPLVFNPISAFILAGIAAVQFSAMAGTIVMFAVLIIGYARDNPQG